MALDADVLIDRRRLRRRIAFWRALAILVVVGALVAGAMAMRGDLGPSHIARLPINGAILSDRPLIQLVERLKRSDSVAGVVVAIDSPGGTSVGGERLYHALRELSEAKPVVAHINTVGASAGYMTAIGADHIVAHRTSLTGSVGVLLQYGNVEELLSDLGVTINKVQSGPLKAEPDLFDTADPAAIAVLQSVVDDTFAWFLDLVAERRELDDATTRQVADGRIYTGAQALEIGLIDEIGGEDAAVAYLVREKGLESDLPLKTYKPKGEGDVSLLARMSDRLVDRVFATFGVKLSPAVDGTAVDGLWSLWHFSLPADTRTFKND